MAPAATPSTPPPPVTADSPYNGADAMTAAPEIEDYLASLIPEDPLLARAAAEARAQRLPIVGRTVGRFLEAMVLAAGARRVLEIGAGNGYTALWLCRSLPPDGGLFSIEDDPRRAAMARAHLHEAGLADRAHIIVGDPARMAHKVAGPFDLVFDAGEQPRRGPPLDRLLTLLRPGGVLIVANLLRFPQVPPAFAPSPTDDGNAVAASNRPLAADPRLLTSFLPLGNGVAWSVKSR